MAPGDADTLGDIVDGDVVGVVELDVLDGVQDILAGRRGALGRLSLVSRIKAAMNR
jgi:hypothetical protein